MITRLFTFESLTLPQGESVLWQGRPSARSLAVRAFHVRLVLAYFALLFAARAIVSLNDGQAWQTAFASASGVAVPCAVAVTLLCGLAILFSRTTRYTVTNRRVLLQFGAALPMTLNVPFPQVAGAGLKVWSDGTGDIPLAVVSEKRLAYLLLWPHVRPWRLNSVEPMLRSVPDAQTVAGILAKALGSATAPAPEPSANVMPLPQPAGRVVAIAAAA